MNFEELLLMFLRLSLLSTSDLQQSCLNVLSGTQVLRNISVCYMYDLFFEEKCRKLIISHCFKSNFEKHVKMIFDKNCLKVLSGTRVEMDHKLNL